MGKFHQIFTELSAHDRTMAGYNNIMFLFHIVSLFSLCSHVIVLGDINTSHKLIDHCDPNHEVCSFAYRPTIFSLNIGTPELLTILVLKP